jgi:transposase
MRCEFSEHEWTAIKPMLPNKPRGVRRVDDRRVLDGIVWVLRSGAPWRDLPATYGPRTTCYNRFVRWRRTGVWDRIATTSPLRAVTVMGLLCKTIDVCFRFLEGYISILSDTK